jgi:hypothetical protein
MPILATGTITVSKEKNTYTYVGNVEALRKLRERNMRDNVRRMRTLILKRRDFKHSCKNVN